MTTSSTPGGARSRAPLVWLAAGAMFMENLDGTVIVTALPAMARDFGVPAIDLNLGVSAYLMAVAVFATASGWIADRFGTRRVFAGAIAGFMLASLLCAASTSELMFIAMRVLQGLAGALMLPVARLVVLRGTPKAEIVHAIAVITWPGLIAPVLGPPLGGFITLHLGWEWIFLLNLPLGALALAAALRLLPDERAEALRPFDWTGFALAGGALLCVMWAMEVVGQPAPPVPVLIGAGSGGLVLGWLALRHFRMSERRLIEPDLLRVFSFGLTVRSGSLFRAAVSAVPFLVPLMLQLGFGLDAFHAGLLVLAIFAGNLVMKTVTTPMLHRFGFRRVLIGNGLALALSIGACGLLAPHTPVALTALVLFVSGMTRSMQFTTVNTLAFADVPAARMSAANTLFNLSAQVSMGMGVAVGALALRLAELVTPALGAAPGDTALPYRLAFGVVALIAALALVECRRLPADAGAALLKKRD
ncbi:MFS transporter [Derxia gummosa]|uniref:MFS transporter n=1 Tax=Derxia gummosa DSM 723 TaxID=1121388 RepID=A0A8B6X2Y9_9BURK|nr:MFS transporter [Derxia gummosa]